jgi:hypothetical protein
MAQKRRFGKHKTLPAELKPAWDFLCRLPEVRRVVLGYGRALGHRAGVGTLEPRESTTSALRVNAHTERGVIELWVHTDQPARVAQLIRGRYPR